MTDELTQEEQAAIDAIVNAKIERLTEFVGRMQARQMIAIIGGSDVLDGETDAFKAIFLKGKEFGRRTAEVKP